MPNITQIKSLLSENAQSSSNSMFFKTDIGGYAEHDKFIGVKVPVLRAIAKDFAGLNFKEIQILIESEINEERFLALVILTNQYQKSDINTKKEIYDFYVQNLKYVNNWNLVDASAHLIIGAHLLNLDKDMLFSLAKSEIMWERRIAIVSTWYFIRSNKLEWTFKISEVLLGDKHDLIHKAVGWMLREAGKRDQDMLSKFLESHARHMPRTMLRYSIEKFQDFERKFYLSL